MDNAPVKPALFIEGLGKAVLPAFLQCLSGEVRAMRFSGQAASGRRGASG